MSNLTEICTRWQSASRSAWTIATDRVDRNLSNLFLGFVALCMVAPLLQTVYPVFGTIVAPLEERRLPNPFPSLRLLLGTNGDFAAGLNKWFDDRVGFRDLFIRTKNQIDYTLFGTSRKVYVGADDWLFYRDNAHPVADLDAPRLAALEAAYVTLARRLNNKGVQLIVVGYPDKSAVYAEKAPREMPRMAAGGNYDQFRNFLAARSDLTFIDAEAIMKREKSKSPEHLYFKTDLHATEIADVPIVKKIVAVIAQAEHRPDIRWDETFTLKHIRWHYGGEARLMATLFPPSEVMPYFDGVYTIGGKEPDGHWYLPDPHVLDRFDDGVGRPFDWQFRSLPELCPQRLPGLALFGNSFSDIYWVLGLHRYFCFIRRARNPISRFKAFYDFMPADTRYFIFEYYEPWVTEVLDDPWFSDNAPPLK